MLDLPCQCSGEDAWARLVPPAARLPSHVPSRVFCSEFNLMTEVSVLETTFVYLTSHFSKTLPSPIENCIYTQKKPSHPTACPSLPHLHLCIRLSLSDQLPQGFGGQCSAPGKVARRDASVEERRAVEGRPTSQSPGSSSG